LIRNLRATPSTDADLRRALLRSVQFRDGDVLVDGVPVRDHADGRLRLSWPERIDGADHRHPLIRHRDIAARREVEEAILRELNRQGIDGERPTSREESKP
jgi:hypothetical protein